MEENIQSYPNTMEDAFAFIFKAAPIDVKLQLQKAFSTFHPIYERIPIPEPIANIWSENKKRRPNYAIYLELAHNKDGFITKYYVINYVPDPHGRPYVLLEDMTHDGYNVRSFWEQYQDGSWSPRTYYFLPSS